VNNKANSATRTRRKTSRKISNSTFSAHSRPARVGTRFLDPTHGFRTLRQRKRLPCSGDRPIGVYRFAVETFEACSVSLRVIPKFPKEAYESACYFKLTKMGRCRSCGLIELQHIPCGFPVYGQPVQLGRFTR
jgi:hypothetical protein